MYYGVACNVTLQYMHLVHFSLFLDTLDSSSSKVNLGISQWRLLVFQRGEAHFRQHHKNVPFIYT